MSSRTSRPGRTTRGAERVFSYVVAHDGGFAPNPFHGWCTLACCKPRVRAAAVPGDLIVGLSRGCERIVTVMRVTERLSFEQYWADGRFRAKRADWDSPRAARRRGDNVYQPDGAGGLVQLRSAHWDHIAAAPQRKPVARVHPEHSPCRGRSTRLAPPRVGGPKSVVCRAGRSAAAHLVAAPQKDHMRSGPAGWPAADGSWRPSCA